MNNFKKIIAVFAAFFCSISFILIVNAQSTTPPTTAIISAGDILPSNVDLVYEFNTNTKNPFIGAIDSLMQSTLTSQTESSSTGDQAIMDIIKKELTSNNLTFAMKLNMAQTTSGTATDPDYYLTLNFDPQDYSSLINDLSERPVSASYDNIVYFNSSDDTFFALINNLLIITNKQANLLALIDAYTKGSTNVLKNNTNYNTMLPYRVNGAFFNVYINPASIMNDSNLQVDGSPFSSLISESNTAFNPLIFKAMLAEGFSVSQIDNGFLFNVAVKGDKDKLASLGLQFDKYNFVPQLYKKISGQDLIMALEHTNTSGEFHDLMNLFNLDSTILTDYNNFKLTFKTESGIDIDTEILPVLGGENLIAIHKTDQIWPAFTLVFDVKDHISQTQQLLVKLTQYVTQQMQKAQSETGTAFFTSTTSTISGTAFYEFDFDLLKAGNFEENPTMLALPSSQTSIKVLMGVTSDGLLIISTHPNLGAIYTPQGQGLIDNAAFNSDFTNRDENISQLFFLGLDGLHSYISSMMDTFKAEDTMKTGVNALFSPWHDLFTKTYGTPDTSWAKGILHVDVAGVVSSAQNFLTVMESSMPVQSELATFMPQGEKTFCDVYESDWYYPYVRDLSTMGTTPIITGYADGCFHPGSPVTRAEFTKLLIAEMLATGKGSQLQGGGSTDGTTYFRDVPSNLSAEIWFAHYVNMAAANHLIKGFNDGTFRPNEPVTRAEAVEILYNASEKMKEAGIQSPGNILPFTDVTEGNWYLTSVTAAYNLNLVQGVNENHFNPGQNLTRAEAAKIIRLFMDLGS